MSHYASIRGFALSWVGLGLIAIPACGQGDMDMMSNHSTAFGEHAGDYRAQLASHGAAVEGATDLSQIALFEAQHVSGTQPHMIAMSHELGDMMGCIGPAGERPDSGQVLGDLDWLQTEQGDHMATMGGLTDIDAAHAEEIRHQARVTGMMDEMTKHADAMMDGAGHYGCLHHAP